MRKDLKFRWYMKKHGMSLPWSICDRFVEFKGGAKYKPIELKSKPMQFTGHRDVNGIEVYEEDVIFHGGGNTVPVRRSECIKRSSGHGESSFSVVTNWFGGYGSGQGFEVIGNTYELNR